MKRNIKYFGLMGLMAFAATACGDEDIDNTFSRTNMVVELTTSTDYVVLDESRPDDVALTISWTDAHPYGNEFITTYQLQYDVTGSKVNAYKEYEDDGHFTRSYTNAQLQQIMVERYGTLTSSVGQLNFTLTASFEGPRVVIPDIATASVRIKTYGAKQFAADRLFVAGTAVGDERIEVQPTTATSGIYVWNGALKAGRLNIPVIYADENNAIGPETADAPIRNDEMDAVISDEASANFWVIPADDNYRVTVDMNKKTVKIIAVGSVIEMDKLYMAGAATGGSDIEVEQTMERESLYAWRGELKAGKLTFPVEFDGKTEMSLVPAEADDHDIHDGTAASFKLVNTLSGTAAAYWEIPADATYRVVVDTDARTVTIYSPEKDMKNTVVSYNNTVDKINPYSQEVTELWIWGGFNASAHDEGMKAGFQSKFKLKQSLANPNVFVYHGENLPRSTSTDDWSKATAQGALNFLVSNIENNVYAFGSTADAKRNSKRGYLPVTLGEEMKLVAGQSDNRYAYFCVPENCNFIVVDIENLTVTFDNK